MIQLEKIDDELAKDTVSLKDRNNGFEKNFIGNFLSRIWALFGPPNSILYEGFNYTFQDKYSGLIFTAYCGACGLAYGGKLEDEEALKPIIAEFDKYLSHVKPVDCEISFETDFGVTKVGAKDGIPYDIYEK